MMFCFDEKLIPLLEYKVAGELPDLFAASDLIISRAGANAICELLALHKPNILIPLSLNASRGDQILNGPGLHRRRARAP